MTKQSETASRFEGADVVYGRTFSAESDLTTTVFPSVAPAKRFFDIVFSTMALIFFLPIMVMIAAVLLLREGGPVFFRHKRVGYAGKQFSCLKFRTMVLDADKRLEELLARDPVARAEWEVNQKLTNDPRISCLGHFLRKTSLDELPQFFNVLKGDMSVVGPRPIVLAEVARYRENIFEYKSVRPGITGLWQVNGRNDTTYEERVAMDTEYARNRSFIGDLRIVFQTVEVVLTGRGAS
ncbi:sugar transferase [Aliiruegeria sabulilitoris]|uniref:sugar transferase n=1 Tax=Aliiruegeria sabulilitoris TaxID=1510458 RepID=UPI0009E8DCFA|nr:sugar transferase [Aliiruegeria sabulilitoris]NDR59018.1 sugar transferase [Pseudoruegeria sp. M32A2M]